MNELDIKVYKKIHNNCIFYRIMKLKHKKLTGLKKLLK